MAKQEYIFNKKNVIVTGGAGFLGSHLCDELLRTSKVICIDSFLSGNDSNIQHLLQHPDFIFVKHDIVKPLRLEGVPELRRFDVEYQGVQEIYHLAAPTAPADYLRLPIETMDASATGTKNVLEWAVRYKASMVYTSSAAVYGEPPDPAKPYVGEEYWGFIDPLGDFSAFTEGKRFGECLTHQYRLHHQLDAKIGMSYYHGKFILDAGYNLYVKSEEKVTLKSFDDDTFGIAGNNYDSSDSGDGVFTASDIATFDDVTIAATAPRSNSSSTPFLSKSDIDVKVAQTRNMVTHKIYGGIGYSWEQWSLPFALGGGASFELVNSRQDALENWAVWFKGAISF